MIAVTGLTAHLAMAPPAPAVPADPGRAQQPARWQYILGRGALQLRRDDFLQWRPVYAPTLGTTVERRWVQRLTLDVLRGPLRALSLQWETTAASPDAEGTFELRASLALGPRWSAFASTELPASYSSAQPSQQRTRRWFGLRSQF